MRRGEELPIAALDVWLKAHVDGLRGTPAVTQYTGGASNWTYRLQYESHDLVLRRPPAGTKARSAHDMRREHDVQRALRSQFPWVPEMVAYCGDPAVIGAEFYVMRRLEGVILRRDPPRGVSLSADTARTLCAAAIDRLADLHAVDVSAAGLASLGKGPGYARRQIEGWIERYDRARTWNVPTFRGVTSWLREHVPDDAGACLIHNDYRLDNLVLDPADLTRIVGILDWELATVGDPLMDLGCSLAYWVEAGDGWLLRASRRQPTHLPGMYTRADVLGHYAERTGRRPGDWRVYLVYGCFRLAGIAQQIYYRYHRGETRNPAFRHFWIWVHVLERRCRRLIG